MKKFLIGFAVGLGVLFAGYATAQSQDQGATSIGTWKNQSFMNATSTSASSSPRVIGGAKSVTLQFTRGDTTGQGNTGSTTFTVWVSVDGTNYVQYNKLIDNVTNTNSQTLTRVATAVLTGTSTKTYTMDLNGESFATVKCSALEVTDGEHTCKAQIRY